MYLCRPFKMLGDTPTMFLQFNPTHTTEVIMQWQKKYLIINFSMQQPVRHLEFADSVWSGP